LTPSGLGTASAAWHHQTRVRIKVDNTRVAHKSAPVLGYAKIAYSG